MLEQLKAQVEETSKIMESAIKTMEMQEKIIQHLVMFYDTVDNMLAGMRHGHTTGLSTVQSMIDVIGDEYDFDAYRHSKFVVTVKQMAADSDLDHEDRENNPSGDHDVTGYCEADALTKFHHTVPISCLEHFRITIRKKE